MTTTRRSEAEVTAAYAALDARREAAHLALSAAEDLHFTAPTEATQAALWAACTEVAAATSARVA